jgi:hypothetical protein
MSLSAQSTDLTRQYRVCSVTGGWRVEPVGDGPGVHVDPANAIAQACERARADADRGCLAIVTAETTPQEFHCYIPAAEARPSPAALPPYLRLLVSR